MKLKLFILFISCTQLVLGQALTQKVTTAYTTFAADSQLKYGLSSLTVLNAQNGELIFSNNAEIGLAPASTLKTITSATAFNLLGKEFKWETSLGYNGTITHGVLKGDVVLTASGDPTLGSSRYNQSKPEVLLQKWAHDIKQAGIQKIEGKIIVDDLLFGTQTIPLGWIWQDIGNYYGAGASAGSWRENEIALAFKPGTNAGDATTISLTDVGFADMTVVNEAKTGSAGSGDNVYAYSSPYSSIIYVRGTYASDFTKPVKVSMPDPALILATELKEKLSDSGILLSGFATTSRKLLADNKAFIKPAVTLSIHQSPALSQVIYWLNQKSLNLYAENILRTIALTQKKTAAFEEATDIVKAFWNFKAGINPLSLFMLDGSGLSPENRVTTATMAKILQSITKETWFNDFYESLPLYNNMKMKSGSIRRVLCYTGYQKSASGIPVVFSFITNNYNGSSSAIKQKMFKVLDSLK